MNKKGFTLIEMLVVIAIIAVLVAIIIPTVSSATEKAGAATNAANLRAVYAEAQTDKLSIGNGDDSQGYVTWSNGKATISATAPKSAEAGDVDKDETMSISEDGNSVYYVNAAYNIDYFAEIAETGKAPTVTPTACGAELAAGGTCSATDKGEDGKCTNIANHKP